MRFAIEGQTVRFEAPGESGCLCACGPRGIRFRSTADPRGVQPQDWTLMPAPAPAAAALEGDCAVLQVGTLRARMHPDGRLEYEDAGRPLLAEQPELAFGGGIRRYRNIGSGLWQARVSFAAAPDEHFYGLGHEANGCFDLKGCVIDLRNVNAKCAIPYLYSSRGYGFLWNLPSTGRCELAANRTRWHSDCTRQIDYVVLGGTPRQAAAALADLTGHAPPLPHWASGIWQSRLRYETQAEVLRVARRYRELGLPLSAIIIDYFHWTEQGDWRFDPACWPDPAAMCAELHAMGVKVGVSVWPTVNEKSENYAALRAGNMLIATARGTDRLFDFYGPQAVIDTTRPATRRFVWEKLRQNYLDNGVDFFWLDETEPEIHPEDFDNLVLGSGRGDETALLYPFCHAQMVWEGMRAAGRADTVTLVRCAYTGAQRFGALVWSGDIPSTFESLAAQVKAGLHMAVCGIPWWNTDIGGFYGGDPDDPAFRELLVRWFQYGVFCPVTRLHGNRGGQDRTRPVKEPTGRGNEPWSFGGQVLAMLRPLMLLRERLRPYIEAEMAKASQSGVPVMRPLFFDFPQDAVCYTLGEEYLFGDDILFAPIVRPGQREKRVYLPAGAWRHTGTGQLYAGGAWYDIGAELPQYIAFVRDGAAVWQAFAGPLP